jgi:molybdopterin-containing oxidoreductase family membrane subunit
MGTGIDGSGPMTEAAVLGIFAHVDTTVRAIGELRRRGFESLRTYSPVPLAEFEEALTGDGLPRSPVRLFTLIGGVTGTASGFALTIWTALKWNLITGGKPVVSIPPFVVIAFEMTILLGGLCTLLGLMVTAPLPNLRGSPRYDPRFTADRFGLEVACPPDQVRAVTEVLRAAGAEEVRS